MRHRYLPECLSEICFSLVYWVYIFIILVATYQSVEVDLDEEKEVILTKASRWTFIEMRNTKLSGWTLIETRKKILTKSIEVDLDRNAEHLLNCRDEPWQKYESDTHQSVKVVLVGDKQAPIEAECRGRTDLLFLEGHHLSCWHNINISGAAITHTQ